MKASIFKTQRSKFGRVEDGSFWVLENACAPLRISSASWIWLPKQWSSTVTKVKIDGQTFETNYISATKYPLWWSLWCIMLLSYLLLAQLVYWTPGMKAGALRSISCPQQTWCSFCRWMLIYFSFYIVDFSAIMKMTVLSLRWQFQFRKANGSNLVQRKLNWLKAV